jgi:hypothetical protein
MEILNQTNDYIEELGQKVNIQKHEVAKIQHGNKKMKNSEHCSEEEQEALVD